MSTTAAAVLADEPLDEDPFARFQIAGDPTLATPLKELDGHLSKVTRHGLERPVSREQVEAFIAARRRFREVGPEAAFLGGSAYVIGHVVARVLQVAPAHINAVARLAPAVQLDFQRKQSEARTFEAKAEVKAEMANELTSARARMLDQFAEALADHIHAACERAHAKHLEQAEAAGVQPMMAAKAAREVVETMEPLRAAVAAWRDAVGYWNAGPVGELNVALERLERTVSRALAR